MPDYFLPEHLAARLAITTDDLADFESRGLIHSVTKHGRRYYSAQDAYRLKGILYLVRKKGLRVGQAVAQLMIRASSLQLS